MRVRLKKIICQLIVCIITIVAGEASLAACLLDGSNNTTRQLSSFSDKIAIRDAAASGYDITTCDVSTMSDFSAMFRNNTTFNQDISGWDVSRALNMSRMFVGASSFNQDISGWDVRRVQRMDSMFEGASSFNQPIGSWQVVNVRDMSSMFYGASSFNQPLNDWNLTSVDYMSAMFLNATSFNQPLNNWDVSGVIDMYAMFYGASEFNQNIGSWDVRQVDDMKSMFEGASAFNQDISAWDVSGVSIMGAMFQDAIAFDQDLSTWNVAHISSEPTNFSLGATAWTSSYKPLWGQDLYPPIFLSVSADPGSNSIVPQARIDEDGTIFYVIVENNSAEPTPAQVQAGQNGLGQSAIAAGSATATGGYWKDFPAVTSLTSYTDYDIYFLAQDDNTTPNVQESVTKYDVRTDPDEDANVTSATGVVEPVNLASTVTSSAPEELFDFTVSDGGGGDNLPLLISEVTISVSGTTSHTTRAKVQWRLNGPDSSNATGVYDPSSEYITFSGLSISVPDGGQETYTISAFFSEATNLTDNETIILSVEGWDFLTDTASTWFPSTATVTNGTGAKIIIDASTLVFSTQPAGSESSAALTTQPVVTAQDAFGNTDVDFTETITLTEASAGTLSGDVDVAAVAGVATFTDVTYTATADQQSFTLTADDESGVGSDLTAVSANAVTSDVVATALAFSTQPAPLTIEHGTATSFTTVPVVVAQDANGVTDTGYTTDIAIAEVNGAGSATFSVTGDTDSSPNTASITPSSGAATFTGLSITYSASGSSSETLNLRASSGSLTTAISSQLTSSDTTAPTVSSVSVPADGTYGAGQTLSFTVNTTEAITVTGTPQIALTIGSATEQATYASGSGSTALVFSYTVQAGDVDADGIAVASSIAASGGTFKDGAGNDLVLTLNSVGSTSAVLVETTAPTVSILNAPSIVNSTSAFSVTFEFSENVTGFAVGDITVTNGSAGNFASVDGNTYTADITPDAGGNVAIDVAANVAQDGAGNNNTAATQVSVTYDAIAPTVSSVSVPSDGTYTAGQTLSLTVNTSEAVTVDTTGGTPQIAITIGSTVRQAVYASGSATASLVFTYTIVSGDLDADGIAVGISITANSGTLKDAAGNDLTLTLNSVGATSGVLVDADAPTVTSVSVPSNGSYYTGGTLSFTVNASEAITVNTSGGVPQIALTIGTATRQASYASGSGSTALVFTYTVQAGDLDTDGIEVASSSITANGGTLADAAGNELVPTLNSVGSTSAVLVDAVAPTVSIQNAPPAVNSTSPFSVTFQFSEDVTGFVVDDITVTNGSADNFGVVDAKTYTADIVPTGIGNIAIDVSANIAEDAAGNTNTTAAQVSIIFDTSAPTVLSVSVPSNGNYKANSTLDFNVNTSDPVNVVGTPEISLTIGDDTVQAIYVEGSGSTELLFRYTVKMNDTDSDGISIGSLSENGGTIKDIAGNHLNLSLNNVGDTAGILIDTTAPTVTITPADGATDVDPDTDIRISFSEPMFFENGTPFASELVRFIVVLKANSADGNSLEFTATLDGNDIVITPANQFASLQTVYVSFLHEAAEDKSENDVGAASSTFTVAQTNSPALDFAANETAIRTVLVDDMMRAVRSSLNASARMMSDVRRRLRGTDGSVPTLSTRSVPLEMDGVASADAGTLSTRGTATASLIRHSGVYRRLFFSDFDIQHDLDTDNMTATLSARLAWEHMVADGTLLGYYVGAEASESDINGTFAGDQTRLGLNAGGYVAHRLADTLHTDAYVSVGVGHSDLDMSNGTLALESDYRSETVTVGASISGAYAYTDYEFRPELAVNYGKTQIGTVFFTGRAYGLVDDTLSLNAGSVSVANITLRPEVIYAIQNSATANTNASLSFSPRLICERTMSTRRTQNCGSGGEVGYTAHSNDGLRNIDFRFAVDKVGSSRRSSAVLGVEMRF